MSRLPTPTAALNIVRQRYGPPVLNRICVIADARRLPPFHLFKPKPLDYGDFHFALALTTHFPNPPKAKVSMTKARIFELVNTGTAQDQWLFRDYYLDQAPSNLVACGQIGILDHTAPDQIAKLMSEIPTSMIGTNGRDLAWTNAAVGVLQERKIVRPMDLVELFRIIRSLAVRTYLGRRPLRNDSFMVSLAEVREMDTATDLATRKKMHKDILKRPLVFDRSEDSDSVSPILPPASRIDQ